MALVAGVDSSTQSCKVIIIDDRTGQPVRSGRAPHPDGTEVHPAAWWQALGDAIRDAGGLDDVEAVAIAGQQHGMVVLDSAGQVIRPALLWHDTRSAAAAEALIDEADAETWVARTGLVPVASFTISKIRWLRDAEPDQVPAIAAIALPHDWLSWRLRGYGPAGESPLGPVLEELATDGSEASGSGYWNPVSRAYDSELFARALGRPLREATSEGDLGAVVVPRVLEPDEAMGILERDVNLPCGTIARAGLVVGAGAGDNAAAALGLNLREGDVVVSLGTSGTVFGVTDAAVMDASGTVDGFADATGRRLPIVTTLNAARVLEVIEDLLGVTHDELAELALAAAPGSDGVILVPYFVGEQTPNRPDATASLFGMTPLTTDRPHLARAAVEGMLCGLADGLAAIEGTGLITRRLLLIGGAARNTAVRTVAAQVFGRDITVPQSGEYVALGAARQASWARTKVLPDWPFAVTQVPADPRPEVRAAYRVRAGTTPQRGR